jgi:hypothetical protein
MTQRARFRTAVFSVALVLLVASCTESDTVRSGDGPTPSSGATTAAGPQTPSDETDSGNSASMTTSTQPEVDAAPSTSAFLTIVGNISVPEGEPGSLTIVMTGPPQRGSVPVIVRNRTSQATHSLEVAGTARTPAGELVGSGASQGLVPAQVGPGEWAFGYVYFGFDDLPVDAVFDLTATGETAPGFLGKLDVRPVELNQIQGSYSRQVVGIVQNESGEDVSGPVSVNVACFDDAGAQLLSTHGSYTDSDELPPGGTSSFSIDMFDVGSCANYVVGASGWSF